MQIPFKFLRWINLSGPGQKNRCVDLLCLSDWLNDWLVDWLIDWLKKGIPIALEMSLSDNLKRGNLFYQLEQGEYPSSPLDQILRSIIILSVNHLTSGPVQCGFQNPGWWKNSPGICHWISLNPRWRGTLVHFPFAVLSIHKIHCWLVHWQLHDACALVQRHCNKCWICWWSFKGKPSEN